MAGITLGAGVTLGPGITATSTGTPPVLVSLKGDNFNGWLLTDSFATSTIDNTIGNPAPSWKFTSRGMRTNLGCNMLNKTITFDVRPSANADCGPVWCNNFGGGGTNAVSIRIFQGLNKDGGIKGQPNGGWLYIGVGSGVTASYFPTADIWYNIKIQIGSDRVCTWFIDGVEQATTYTIPAGYTSANTTDNWFGFDVNTSTVYFDNLTVYSGIV
jgi:hypothetical protein